MARWALLNRLSLRSANCVTVRRNVDYVFCTRNQRRAPRLTGPGQRRCRAGRIGSLHGLLGQFKRGFARWPGLGCDSNLWIASGNFHDVVPAEKQSCGGAKSYFKRIPRAGFAIDPLGAMRHIAGPVTAPASEDESQLSDVWVAPDTLSRRCFGLERLAIQVL